jgi:CHAT domain-containing protein
MKSPIAALLFCCFTTCPALQAQSACDTNSINTSLQTIRECLDREHYPAAISAAQDVRHTLARCTLDAPFAAGACLQIASCYEAASADYFRKGMINQHIDMLERSVATILQAPGTHTERLAKAYTDLALAHGLNHNEKLAVEMGQKALEIRQNARPDDPKLALNYQQLISELNMLDDTASMHHYLQEWEALHRKLGKKTPLQYRLNLANSWAFYYDHKDMPERMIQVMEDTLAAYGETLRSRGGFVGPTEFRLAKLYADMGQFEKSWFYAEKNVELFKTRLKEQQGKLFGRSHYAWCLSYAARAAWGMYQQTRDTLWFHRAETRCHLAEAMVFDMRDRKPNDGFREWMVDSDILGNLTEVRQQMYAETGNMALLERNFEASEAVKTFASQQFLHETYALRWGGIPDSLYQLETRYRTAINDLETNFFMVRKRPNADSLIAANNDQLFVLRDAYQQLLAHLEQHYPEYYRLKYTQPVVTLRDVQQNTLLPGQCLLDLHLKNEKVFALLIRPDTVVWIATACHSAEMQALETLMEQTQNFAKHQHLPEAAYLEQMQRYADAAFQVYSVLIQPVSDLLLEEVILVPRHSLAVIPFGALLRQRETNMAKPFLWHFLDKSLVLSQAPSVSMFQFAQNRPKRILDQQPLLAMAPFFEGNLTADVDLPVGEVARVTRSNGFEPLPGSGIEAQAVARRTKGSAIVGARATKSSFLNQCARYNILHLATHSAANEVLGEYSFIAFHGEKPDSTVDLLYARDVYGLQLSADLVVLSACETATGQYRVGDGVIGLTRAFTCAGARNIMASQWAVNDASTRALMELLYDEIGRGLPYNRALALAKRKFLQRHKQNAHPFFWAGFVLNGR